jgi:hypothetical protein
MINAERILQTLDRHLDHSVKLVIYGRAAIALGFDHPPDTVKHSLDVDGIISASQAPILRTDTNFWDAQEATNAELDKDGLYITHLFEADQVFLRPDWEQRILRVTRPSLRWLQLFRPATVDLILTKMMRGDDAQDMADIQFMIGHDRVAPEQLEAAFDQAVIPDLQELRDAFERAKPRVREMARRAAASS